MLKTMLRVTTGRHASYGIQTRDCSAYEAIDAPLISPCFAFRTIVSSTLRLGGLLALQSFKCEAMQVDNLPRTICGRQCTCGDIAHLQIWDECCPPICTACTYTCLVTSSLTGLSLCICPPPSFPVYHPVLTWGSDICMLMETIYASMDPGIHVLWPDTQVWKTPCTAEEFSARLGCHCFPLVG